MVIVNEGDGGAVMPVPEVEKGEAPRWDGGPAYGIVTSTTTSTTATPTMSAVSTRSVLPLMP